MLFADSKLLTKSHLAFICGDMSRLADIYSAWHHHSGNSIKASARTEGISYPVMHRIVSSRQAGAETRIRLAGWLLNQPAREIGAILRRWRTHTDRTRFSVAEEIGLTVSQYEALEAGRLDATTDALGFLSKLCLWLLR